jgi:D-alanyl-lipoteichoic acid acyltransferase DltB (MBOAT superfamily)
MIDFWTRWHMSLTRFLTAYVYNPILLAISRRWVASGRPLPKRGKTSIEAYFALIAFPTIATMLLAGIWHGAGYQFAIFGLLNGIFIAICHKWRLFKQARGWRDRGGIAYAISVFAVVISFTLTMVFFKSPGVKAGIVMIGELMGRHGFLGQSEVSMSQLFIGALLFAIVWTLPNSQEILGIGSSESSYRSQAAVRLSGLLTWRPSLTWAFSVGLMTFASLFMMALGRESPFLYFQF